MCASIHQPKQDRNTLSIDVGVVINIIFNNLALWVWSIRSVYHISKVGAKLSLVLVFRLV